MKDSSIMLIVGTGIFLGFLGYLAYMAFLTSQGGQSTQQYSPARISPDQYFGGAA